MKYSTQIMRAEFFKTFRDYSEKLNKFNLDTSLQKTRPMYENDSSEEGYNFIVYANWFGQVTLNLSFDGVAWYLNVNAKQRTGFSNSEQFTDLVEAMEMVSHFANAIQDQIENSR